MLHASAGLATSVCNKNLGLFLLPEGHVKVTNRGREPNIWNQNDRQVTIIQKEKSSISWSNLPQPFLTCTRSFKHIESSLISSLEQHKSSLLRHVSSVASCVAFWEFFLAQHGAALAAEGETQRSIFAPTKYSPTFSTSGPQILTIGFLLAFSFWFANYLVPTHLMNGALDRNDDDDDDEPEGNSGVSGRGSVGPEAQVGTRAGSSAESGPDGADEHSSGANVESLSQGRGFGSGQKSSHKK